MKAGMKSAATPWLAMPDVKPRNRWLSGNAYDYALGRAQDGSWTPTFLAVHWAPVLVLAVSAGALMSFHADQWLADRLYAWQGHHWLFRSTFVTEDLTHLVGRDLSTVAWLCLLAVWVMARLRNGPSTWRTPLTCLLVSTVLATALVAWIKSWSNMDCPWDLTRYGGAREYVGLLGLRPAGMPRAACFPAGHASAGYAWMALYFFFLATRPQWRWFGLAVGISIGVLFGATQQLRGAHFLSHDVWTAAICWASAFGGYLLFHPRPHATLMTDVCQPRGHVAVDTRIASWPHRAGTR